MLMILRVKYCAAEKVKVELDLVSHLPLLGVVVNLVARIIKPCLYWLA